VVECERRGCELHELPLDVYRAESDLFGEDVLAIDVESALAARDLPGGTAPRRVREAAGALRTVIGPGLRV
jgi:argininosuccinate lyase